MKLSSDLVGTALGPVTGSWNSRDCALYALAIGAGQADPLRELDFTTSRGVVYPTFGALTGGGAAIRAPLELLGDAVDTTTMLHAGQVCEQLAPLPTEGSVIATGRITALWDKGNATVLETVVETADAGTGRLYCRNTVSLFFRGTGGWGGERGLSGGGQPVPDRRPDRVLTAPTRRDQALLYRLTGDTNPLHVDPDFAARAGFERPILHGMCAYGVVGRVLLSSYAAADPKRFISLAGRFSKPTMPGDTLAVHAWQDGGEVSFVVNNQHGYTVIANGVFTFME